MLSGKHAPWLVAAGLLLVGLWDLPSAVAYRHSNGRVFAGVTHEGLSLTATGGATKRATGDPVAKKVFQIVCDAGVMNGAMTFPENKETRSVIGLDGEMHEVTEVVRVWQVFRLPCNGGTYEVQRCIIGDCPIQQPVPPPPPPGDVVPDAVERAPWEFPQPIFSPAHRSADDLILVGLPFFWAIDPAQWYPVVVPPVTACNGFSCTTVHLTGTPTILTFDPGVGESVIATCRRPGSVIRSAEDADAQEKDCQVVFQDRGVYASRVGIHYEIAYSWENSIGGSGGGVVAGGHDVWTAATLTVKESQPVIVG